MERVVYDRMQALEQSHWWFTGRRAILARLIGALALPAGARILEAGCGTGGNLSLLQRFGAVSALEPDAPSRRYVAERWGVAADPGLLPGALPYPPASFDAVCAFDVIEHVEDDAGSVRALASLLRDGGHFIATVPAYRWMWSGHDELHHHKRRYRLAEMRALFEAAGLTVVRASYFNTLLFPLAAAVRLARRALGLKGEDDAMPPAPVNALLARLFSLEAPWLARRALPFGLSIVVVGRR